MIREQAESMAKPQSIIDRIKNKIESSIDKYTKIDDILREVYKQNQITNRILLAIYIRLGKVSPTIPTQPQPIVLEPTPNELPLGDLESIFSDNYTSKVEYLSNKIIVGSKKIFDKKMSGVLVECKFHSSNLLPANKVYNVRILADGGVVYDDSYANFEARNNYESDMTCYEDSNNNFYVLIFQNIVFTNSLVIEVYGSTTTFTEIYLKYHKKVGI